MGHALSTSRALVLREAAFGYRGKPVLEGVSGRFESGSLTAVTGPNGAGKTTLLKGLLGMVPPSRGSVERPADARSIAYLAQADAALAGFPVEVGDFVAMGLWPRIGSLGGVSAAQAEQVDRALAAVGLRAWRRRWLGELSGGQRQRVRFARLIAQDAPVIVLDEPFAAVDQETTADLLALLAGWHAEGRTVIAVLHDLDLVRASFPRVLALAGGGVRGWGDTCSVLA